MTPFEEKRKAAATGYVPFLVAEWMRRRKYNPMTAQVSKGLDAVAQAQCDLDTAYEKLEAAITELTQRVNTVAQHMEQEQGGARGL